MNNQNSENVVRKSVTVGRDVQSAFKVWTEHIGAWWPVGHSISGDPKTEVFIEGTVGGRFFERTPDGVEHDWGKVTVWEPPHRLVFSWYLGSGQQLPTQVNVYFVPLSDNKTRVEVEHRGPELIGELWWLNIAKYNAAWEKILVLFDAGCKSVS